VQVIESVLPSQAARVRESHSTESQFRHAGAVVASLFVVVPLLGFGAFEFILWLLGIWIEMTDTFPLLLAQ
jgi:hypothetical protein